jgi:nucleoside-diphosphate-sugar epimerase
MDGSMDDTSSSSSIILFMELCISTLLCFMFTSKVERNYLLRNVVVVGSSGQVGSGVYKAFAAKKWNVIAVDPKEEEEVTKKTSDGTSSKQEFDNVQFVRKKSEEVSDDEWNSWFLSCCEVCYAAEEGNRDIYVANPHLERDNSARFTKFVEGLGKIWSLRDENITRTCKLHISYCGGSWTRREMDAQDFSVNDNSPVKTHGGSNMYERAKTAAYENAKDLARRNKDWCQITFVDYISVVPNFAPNFTIGKMVHSAMESGEIVYSEGDYGRPLLHSQQAGDILVTLAERWSSLKGCGQKPFDIILIPGYFTPFATFASIARDVVVKNGGKIQEEIKLTCQSHTPEFLRSRCSSDRLARDIQFVPHRGYVEEGLRNAALKAFVQYTA